MVPSPEGRVFKVRATANSEAPKQDQSWEQGSMVQCKTIEADKDHIQYSLMSLGSYFQSSGKQ